MDLSGGLSVRRLPGSMDAATALALAHAWAISPEPTSVYETRGVLEVGSPWAARSDPGGAVLVDGELVRPWTSSERPLNALGWRHP